MKKTYHIDHIRALATRLHADSSVSKKVRERIDWIVFYCENGCSVQLTSEHFYLNPVTFYRLLRRFDPSDPATLEDKSRRPHTIRALPPQVAALITDAAARNPHLSREKLLVLLAQEHGVMVSLSTVTRILKKTSPVSQNIDIHIAPAPVAVPQQPAALAVATPPAEHILRGLHRILMLGSVTANIAFVGLLIAAALLGMSPAVTPASVTQNAATSSAGTP